MKWIVLILFCLSAQADLPPRFLHALHLAESMGKKHGVKDGDGGRAIGPFQIHRAYWEEAVAHRNIGGRYEDCRDYNYSVRVVNSCLDRWARRYIEQGNWEAVARIHNGGPAGHKKKATRAYWRRVKAELN